MNGGANYFKLFFLLITIIFVSFTHAQDLSFKIKGDLVSRYIWRGLNVNDQPNIQPSAALGYSGFELGLWGSYGLANQGPSDEYYSTSQEIDTWLGYAFSFG